MPCRSWASWIGTLVLLTLASPALAQTEPVQSAEELVEEGIAARRAGDDRTAVAAFQRAYGLAPLPRTAAQLGLAQQALGQWVEAHERLTEALAAESDPWVARNREALTQALGVVQAEVGTVEVLIEGEVPEGARASLGARDLGALPMARAVVALAGEEALEVTAPGRRTVRRDVRVRAGQLSRVTVALRVEEGAAGAAGAGTTGTADAAGHGSGEWPAWQEGGAGTAGAGSAGAAATTDDRAAPGGGDDWIVWVIVGAVAVVGIGVAVGVVASQQSLEAPIPGTAGAVELLRF